ncbi:MAG TPA: hypothetical protein VNU46_06935 [Gemmatimonadaceae bacterium]|nr:hypothetical protein [Gemmatimonadaceae bacterium]
MQKETSSKPHMLTHPYSNTAARAAAATLRPQLGALTPQVAIILGSGLGALTEAVHNPVRIPYTDIPNFPPTHVAGHAGTLVAGLLDQVPVLIFSGRLHLYEGHSAPCVAGGEGGVDSSYGV